MEDLPSIVPTVREAVVQTQSGYPNFVAPDAADSRLGKTRRFSMLVDGKPLRAASGETVTRHGPG